jgi:protoporphyrinogen oxidase
MKMEKVIVAGGGCAGLTSAYTLKKNGYDVTVYEAATHIGGRMHIWEKDGFIVDEYAQFVHPGYKIAREIIDEFKLDLHPFELGAGARLWFRNKWVAAFPDPNDPEALSDTKEWIDYMGEENFNGFVATVEKYCKGRMYEGDVDWMSDVDADDGSNFGEYVTAHFGPRVLEVFAQPILAAIGLEYPEKTGVGFGLQIAWTVLVGGAAVVKKGLGQLAVKMAETLDPQKVHLNAPVEEIVIDGDRVRGIKTKAGEFVAADKVVCAVPAVHALRMLPNLPDDMKKPMEMVSYCPTIHSTLFFDKRLGDGKLVCCLLPRTTNEPFCSFLYQSGRSKWMLPDDNSDSVSAFFYGDGAAKYLEKSDEEIARETLAVIRRYKPDTPDSYLFSHIVRAPIANYTMHNGAPTAIKRLRDECYTKVKGLYLAAEYMYTGSYESAIAAGRRAADVVMGKADRI